jgi:hypothetical protein
MNPKHEQNQGSGSPGAIAAALGVLVTLGWIASQAPPRHSVYLADSPPAQAAPLVPPPPAKD